MVGPCDSIEGGVKDFTKDLKRQNKVCLSVFVSVYVCVWAYVLCVCLCLYGYVCMCVCLRAFVICLCLCLCLCIFRVGGCGGMWVLGVRTMSIGVLNRCPFCLFLMPISILRFLSIPSPPLSPSLPPSLPLALSHSPALSRSVYLARAPSVFPVMATARR